MPARTRRLIRTAFRAVVNSPWLTTRTDADGRFVYLALSGSREVDASVGPFLRASLGAKVVTWPAYDLGDVRLTP